MKQLIIMMAMVMLGVALFALIAGRDEGSILNVMKGIWEQEIQIRTDSP